MSATTTRSPRRRRAGRHDAHEGDDERWLLTYADMITLLMALFMVLFSISSVNTSKYESLQRSLKDAFSGRILPGGEGVTQAGGSERDNEPPAASLPIPAIRVLELPQAAAGKAQREDEDFRRLKRQIDAYAREQGLHTQIFTDVRRRGLLIRVLTDDLLFDSGEAEVKAAGGRLLDRIASLLVSDTHSIAVEGHTDPVPISTHRFPSNWELSTARASSVVRRLTGHGVAERRFEAAGYAALHPIDDNSTFAGRTRNRRVEIVLLRRALGRQKGPVTP
jgi:chemotaxis protein MotB